MARSDHSPPAEGAQLAAALVDAHMLALYSEKAWRSAALSLVSS